MTQRNHDQLTLFEKGLYHEAFDGQDQDDGSPMGGIDRRHSDGALLLRHHRKAGILSACHVLHSAGIARSIRVMRSFTQLGTVL
jgi:hypothetical protein